MKNTTAAVRVLLFPMILCLSNGIVAAQESPVATTTDDGQADKELAAIRQSAAQFVDAFNHEDAKAISELWTKDGDYIDEAGQVFAGREAIAKEYQDFFDAHEGVKMQLTVDSLRLLSSDAAVEDGHAVLEPLPAGAPAISKYTVVHVKVDGKWLMSTVRDSRVETPSAYHRVADLEWLIGRWTAEEHGAKAEFVCRWIANKSFVERRFTVTHADQSIQSGVEIIGYNPQRGHIQSWHFQSDGGYAVGVWSPLKNGWQANIQGVTAQGVPTSAVNLLVPLDDGAYVWQSVQRRAGGSDLPDTDEVILRRAGDK